MPDVTRRPTQPSTRVAQPQAEPSKPKAADTPGQSTETADASAGTPTRRAEAQPSQANSLTGQQVIVVAQPRQSPSTDTSQSATSAKVDTNKADVQAQQHTKAEQTADDDVKLRQEMEAAIRQNLDNASELRDQALRGVVEGGAGAGNTATQTPTPPAGPQQAAPTNLGRMTTQAPGRQVSVDDTAQRTDADIKGNVADASGNTSPAVGTAVNVPPSDASPSGPEAASKPPPSPTQYRGTSSRFLISPNEQQMLVDLAQHYDHLVASLEAGYQELIARAKDQIKALDALLEQTKDPQERERIKEMINELQVSIEDLETELVAELAEAEEAKESALKQLTKFLEESNDVPPDGTELFEGLEALEASIDQAVEASQKEHESVFAAAVGLLEELGPSEPPTMATDLPGMSTTAQTDPPGMSRTAQTPAVTSSQPGVLEHARNAAATTELGVNAPPTGQFEGITGRIPSLLAAAGGGAPAHDVSLTAPLHRRTVTSGELASGVGLPDPNSSPEGSATFQPGIRVDPRVAAGSIGTGSTTGRDYIREQLDQESKNQELGVSDGMDEQELQDLADQGTQDPAMSPAEKAEIAQEIGAEPAPDDQEKADDIADKAETHGESPPGDFDTDADGDTAIATPNPDGVDAATPRTAGFRRWVAALLGVRKEPNATAAPSDPGREGSSTQQARSLDESRQLGEEIAEHRLDPYTNPQPEGDGPTASVGEPPEFENTLVDPVEMPGGGLTGSGLPDFRRPPGGEAPDDEEGTAGR